MSAQAVEKKLPEDRLVAALQQFAQVNKTLPAGLPPFSLPDYMYFAAGVDALAELLIAKGVITEDEYRAGKTMRAAEMVEEMTDQARALKREAMGLVIAGSNPQI